MNALDAVERVLSDAREPMTAQEITSRILAQDLWQTQGKTPWDTIEARLAVDIRGNGTTSRFQRCAPRLFALRSWKYPEYVSKPFKKKVVEVKKLQVEEVPSDPVETLHPEQIATVSFSDAAEHVLNQFGNRKPMHYRDITRRALDLGLIVTRGQTPEQTMYAQLLTDIERQKKRGRSGRFAKYGNGFIGLSVWVDASPAYQIEAHNRKARHQLREKLHTMPSVDFEKLIGLLLVKLGFEQVQVTSPTRDGGIDVRGTLVVASVIRTRMAVQVKRWRRNVQAPTVREVRGSLGTHDQGLIITTSDFASGAREEAERLNAVPVALMNGEELVELLVEHSLGITRTPFDLLDLGAINVE